MNTRLSSQIWALALAATICQAGLTAQAGTVTFVVDPTQSSLTLSGAAFGLAVYPQSTNSLFDHWGGTIVADLTGGVLTFTGGSSITALLNPSSPFSTFPNPGTGGVDNYGVFSSGLVTGVGLVLQLNGAYRSLTLDITSGTAINGSAPAGGNFQFTGGHLDWGAVISPSTPYGGTSSMIGVNGANTAGGLVTFDGTTLSLPVQLHTLGANRYEDWTGKLVAVVPEPSSMALGVLGLGLIAARARRNRQS